MVPPSMLSRCDTLGFQPSLKRGVYGGTYPFHSSLEQTNHEHAIARPARVKSNLLMVHASPRDVHSSVSFDVRQLRSKPRASLLSSGDTTFVARSGVPCRGSLLASTIRLSGVKRKWTSSGAFGS